MTEELRNLKFFIRTFGCQMNESDSERIAGILRQAGAIKTDRLEELEEEDILIVNTCAVRQKSEEKLYSYLGRLARLKRKKPVQVGVTGCVAQLRGPELLQKKFDLDFILGPDNYGQLPRLIQKGLAKKHISTSWSKEWQETQPDLILRENAVSAYVTIMEGCDNFCTYCIVPFTRGREKCRPLRSILTEVSSLADRGYKEIQLLGQNVNSFRDPESGKGFPQLLEEISRIEGIAWVRFLTSHPKNFSLEIGKIMAGTRTICRQLHLPLQSGSTTLLRKMRRGYTKDDYLNKVAWLRRLMPEISLSTDIIVGFPGETDKDFEETLEVLGEVRFANIFSFCYSPRPLTEASKFEDTVPLDEKRSRLKEVQRLQKKIQLQSHSRLVGRVMPVLCLGRGAKTPHLYAGRNEGYQVVNFRSEQDFTGRFVDVRITAYGPFSLSGERLDGR